MQQTQTNTISSLTKYIFMIIQQLNFDPYGYYKPRRVVGREPGQGLFWYPDYPQINNHWIIDTPLIQYDERDLDEALEYSNSK